jgi:hypothetical protein
LKPIQGIVNDAGKYLLGYDPPYLIPEFHVNATARNPADRHVDIARVQIL